MAEVRESYLVKIDTPTPARIWSGIGDLVIPADAVETAPAKYLGAGELLNVADFQQLMNGFAERLDFVVSGVDADMVAMAREEAPDVDNAMVYLGRVDFDAGWQIIGVEWEAVFRANTLTIDNQSSAGQRVRTITLSIGNGDTDRSYSPISFFTDADQRLRSPTDDIFKNVGNINQGVTRTFGPRTESD